MKATQIFRFLGGGKVTHRSLPAVCLAGLPAIRVAGVADLSEPQASAQGCGCLALVGIYPP